MPRLLLAFSVVFARAGRRSRVSATLLAIAGAAAAGEFPAPANSGADAHLAAPPVHADAAAASLQLPAGFRATVFAAEPDVQNPVAMAWDGRGRLWVAENYTYAEREVRFDRRLRDRVVVFSDRGGDGRFSARRVFIDSVQRLTSVEVGLGGVWLMCPPRLLFVPDRDGDAVPDDVPQVMLDGFVVNDVSHHNFANGLRFGPDGWLYGRCGAAQPAEIGVPGSSAAERVPVRGTVWRFHPGTKVFEALGGGATNPWGHDWDADGELFFINTVNGHLWHGIPGAHFQRANTIESNPHVYELIDHHADHWHFDTNRSWQQSRDGAANALGGGHAHVGMMIYQGRNWPDAYRGGLFTLNYHGRRANHERLERHGSGYLGRHAGDPFVWSDPWFRGIEIGYGPDGGVYVLDWSDTGECHNSTGVNRRSGRIYKITYGEARWPAFVDMDQARGRDLAALQSDPNEWLVRRARLELATRSAAGHPLTHGVEDLRAMFATHPDRRVKLRALWALHALGAAEPEFLRTLLAHADEHVRTWAIRLLTDRWPLDTQMSRRPARPDLADARLVAEFAALARRDESGLVRLALASVLQRVPPAMRTELARALVSRASDAADHNLPRLIWHGLIPLAAHSPVELVPIAAACELPATRRLIARRLTEEIEAVPAALNALLGVAADRPVAFQADLLDGMLQALKGWRRATKPASWDALVAVIERSPHGEPLLARVRELNVLFGDGRALADVKALALDARADLSTRKAALAALIEARPPDLREICERLLRVRFLNPAAARGLAQYDDPALGELIASAHSTFFHQSERHLAIDVLASRPAFARALLDYVAAGRIARDAITPFHARQIRNLGDAELTRRLAETWGVVRESSDGKRGEIERWKRELPPDVLASANKSAGRAVFTQYCGACHRLHGEGGLVGPDLTGAGRDNLDYLLENIVDPAAVVTPDFRLTIVKLKDGRMLNGFVPSRTADTLTVRTMSETQTVARNEIVAIEESAESLMPEGLLQAMTDAQRRDLIAYLLHPSQVPPLASDDGAR